MAPYPLVHGRNSVSDDGIVQFPESHRSFDAARVGRHDARGCGYLERGHHRLDLLRRRVRLTDLGTDRGPAWAEIISLAFQLRDRDFHRGDGALHQCVAVFRGARSDGDVRGIFHIGDRTRRESGSGTAIGLRTWMVEFRANGRLADRSGAWRDPRRHHGQLPPSILHHFRGHVRRTWDGLVPREGGLQAAESKGRSLVHCFRD